MITLRPPVKTDAELKAIAAAGRGRIPKAALAEIQRRTRAGLAKAVAS